MASQTINNDEIKVRQAVRDHYAGAARNVSSCCGGGGDKASSCGCGTSSSASEPSTKEFYNAEDFNALPEDVTNISLGCGDPVTLASLKPGQTVLDLGSGGGIDCFLAGKKVGSTGKVIGVDMTPEMLDKARTNKVKVGAENVEFRLGEIEHLPVSDSSVDVVISNCVINLSTDKPQVLGEILRVLKPGGRMAVSDIVTSGDLPDEVKASMSAWAGCIAGAMDADEMTALLKKTGFTNISLKPVYFSEEMVADAVNQAEYSGKMSNEELKKTVFSANISAEKPA
ncbi:MAG TPA: arsenite S-adenosylmethyltransferase [Anaerolineaceae bacterium]|nr:arsenite S-adenosylmethyltransferase [Anaerolineaceae bacterium]